MLVTIRNIIFFYNVFGRFIPEFNVIHNYLCFTEWADKLTESNKGKHFIGDFLPPDELERFMETYRVRETYRIK